MLDTVTFDHVVGAHRRGVQGLSTPEEYALGTPAQHEAYLRRPKDDQG